MIFYPAARDTRHTAMPVSDFDSLAPYKWGSTELQSDAGCTTMWLFRRCAWPSAPALRGMDALP
eukprot:4322213-Pleurochrysis_carterae.AAC.1